jgi:hypothetical protein
VTDTPGVEHELTALRAALFVAGQEAVNQTPDGKFYPFGGEFRQDGSIDLVAPEPEPAQASVEPSVSKLLAHFRGRLADASFRAFGICFVVSDQAPGASSKGDALMLHLESRSGVVTRVFWPFDKTLDGRTKFGEPYAREVSALLAGK